jgi:protease I
MTKQTSVVALVADGYQDLDFWYPVLRMQEAGFQVTIVGPDGRSPVHSGLGYPVIPHKPISDAPSAADLVLIPGGGAGSLIAHDAAFVDWVRRAHQAGGVVACVGAGNAVVEAADLGDSERLISAAGTAQLPEYVATVVRRTGQHN